MNKQMRCDVTTPLLWEEEDALQRIAKKMKTSAAGALRLGLYALLEQHEPQTVKTLVKIRLTRKQVAGTVCLVILAASWLQAAITGNAVEFRRGRSVCVRVIRTGRFEFEGGEG